MLLQLQWRIYKTKVLLQFCHNPSLPVLTVQFLNHSAYERTFQDIYVVVLINHSPTLYSSFIIPSYEGSLMLLIYI